MGGAKGGPPVAIDDGQPVRGTCDWQQISVTARAPNNAGRAWILLKVIASGTATFDDVEFREANASTNLAPNGDFETGGDTPAGWSFQNWGGGNNAQAQYVKTEGHSGPACVRIVAPRAADVARPFQNLNAAVYDWSIYWYEAAADYINSLAQLTKRLDPSRPTVTYLTMSWAFPSEWDETQRSAIAPDEVAMRGKDIDIFGMQLCAADGDPYRVTACLDLMRKYREAAMGRRPGGFHFRRSHRLSRDGSDYSGHDPAWGQWHHLLCVAHTHRAGLQLLPEYAWRGHQPDVERCSHGGPTDAGNASAC